MPLYYLSYNQHHAHQSIDAELARFDAVAVMQSLWCFEFHAANSSNHLLSHFQKFVAQDESLIVIEIKSSSFMNMDNNPPGTVVT